MAVCVITGCSSGFGEAIALAFAARGDAVIATMRNPGAAPEALHGRDNIELAALDVTDATARRDLIEEVVKRHGRLDVLVNNAGVVASASVEDTSEEVSRRIFETNYFAPVEMMRLVVPIMRAQGGGRIVNVTAIGALFATPLLSIYCASKHALDSAGASVDLEGRPFGVRAPSVLPGQFKTAIADKSPAPVVTPPYQGIADSLAASRAARAADVQSDLGQVVEAVIAAATDPEPKARYLAGLGIALALEPALAELEKVHAFDAARAGVATPTVEAA